MSVKKTAVHNHGHNAIANGFPDEDFKDVHQKGRTCKTTKHEDREMKKIATRSTNSSGKKIIAALRGSGTGFSESTTSPRYL